MGIVFCVDVIRRGLRLTAVVTFRQNRHESYVLVHLVFGILGLSFNVNIDAATKVWL